jgi:fatty acid desaturase
MSETTVAAGLATPPDEFSARFARTLVGDLMRPNPVIYWIDLVLSTAITYSAIAVYLGAVPFSLVQFLAFIVGGFGLFRIATFMHEIVHLRKGHMRAFKLMWNVCVGIPLLTPSLFYTSHADHHSNRIYATPGDGEYLPFGRTARSDILRFIAMIPCLPLLAIARALLIVPVSFAIPKLRHWLLARASAAVISPSYRRRHVPNIWDPWWLACDLACFAYTASVVALTLRGYFSYSTLGMLYLLVMFSITLNWLRTLAAHRYNGTGNEMSHTEQVLDSINITGHSALTELLYPVGLRYHALHHLLPSIPYHALAKAHRRLLTTLPIDSPYHRCSCTSTFAALRQLWRAAASSADGGALRQFWRET